MRRKITLAYISNNQERKASYKKRKNGFIKKLMELCTLCAVEACCILYSPYEAEAAVWPNPEAVLAVLERFGTISPTERTRKMVNQESYNVMRIKKSHNQLYKIHKGNKRRKLELYMFKVIHGMETLDCFDTRDVRDMNCIIDEFLRNVEVQINKFKDQMDEGTSRFLVGSSFNCAVAAGVTIMSEVEVAVASVCAMSEAETTANVAATTEAPTPLIPSLDRIYGTNDDTTLHQRNKNYVDYNNALNEHMNDNSNNDIPNYGASDGWLAVLDDGNNMRNLYLAGFNADDNVDDGGDRDHDDDNDVDGDDEDDED